VSRFSDCFLLLFGQIAVGGVAGLAVPPFTSIDRGFYRSSAGLFLAFAGLFLAGKIALLVRGDAAAGAWPEVAVWALFTGALALYTASLWGDSNARRARSFAAALLLGVAALTVSALRFRLGPALGPGTLIYPLAFLASALALGAVVTGMLLGHWYLIDIGLSIEPLERVYRFFLGALLAQVAIGVLGVLLLAATTNDGGAAAASLWRDQRALLLTRVVLGPVAALGVAWLIHRTLRIPQTMAATGLFYIAILAVLVGEMLGRLILLRTSLPL
jgi:hypothetical protein